MAKEPPPEPPRLVLAYWWLRTMVTWPLTVREMKRAGFRRTGWMSWETGPPDGD